MSTDFGIEWAYGEFHIARFHHGECVEQWTSPYPVNDLSDINSALYDASEHIDLSRGGDIAIAYEDDMHTHEFVETPKMSRRDLEKFLQRRVERHKAFEGDAAWCYHDVSRNQQSTGVLLHLMPKRIVDAVIRICEEYNLRARRLVPLTEIMSEHVPSYQAKDDDVILVIALFATRVQMIVAHGNGNVLFVRELKHSWKSDAFGRFIVEINRTIGYARQHIGPILTGAYIIGEYAPQLIDEIKSQLDVKVEVDEQATARSFWMQEVSELPQKLSSNFIPRLARRALTRKAGIRFGVLVATGLSVASLLIAAVMEIMIAQTGYDEKMMATEITSLELKIEDLKSDLRELETNEKRLNQLTADAFNLPAVFLSHLGALIPANMSLTQANINRSDAYWDIELTGTSKLLLSELPFALAQLEAKLVSPPWNVSITQSWQEVWMEQLRNGGAAQDMVSGFQISGRLR